MREIRDTNVAVVGGAGFLGSHCVDHLIEDRNCKVLVIDNLVVGRREWINSKADFEYADICDSEHYLYRLFKAYEVEYVLNYAAFPYIPVSFARPLHVFAVNANGALNVINAAQDAGCKGVMQISSAEIYGDGAGIGENKKIDENAAVVPHSSYGASKAAIDAMIQVRWREAKTPCIALRQFNCVGARESHEYIVPEVISQLARQKHPMGTTWSTDQVGLVRLGNNSFRDFLWAGDQAAMAVELLEKGQFGDVYNLGSESGIQIYDLARLIGKVMGFADVQVDTEESRIRPWEIWRLLSDNGKIYSVIDSRPTKTMEEALKIAVDDYTSNGKWAWE